MKLDDARIRYIVRARDGGERASDIAAVLHVSRRRVEQVYSLYKSRGEIPSIHRVGRKAVPLTEDEIRLVLDGYRRYRAGAVYLEHAIERDHGIHINHDRIQGVLKMHGLSSGSPRKWIRRRWVRYEREYSNSMWHADWHEIKDKRWKGEWLILYEDDASRFVTGHGKFGEATSSHSVEILKEAMMKYGRPKSILTDRGIQFYAVETEMRRKGLTEFELFLLRNHVRQILARVSHPQTNGKVEKLFDEFEKKVKFFSSVEEWVRWYNVIRPHGALDFDTPYRAYYRKMAQAEALTDPSVLAMEVES
ncbi:MAG: transposase [Nitrososphaerota archaeon]|nr:transposase [Nitrososphaerota archaeon]